MHDYLANVLLATACALIALSVVTRAAMHVSFFRSRYNQLDAFSIFTVISAVAAAAFATMLLMAST